MANLASSAVTVLEAWTEGGLTGKRNVAKRVTLILTGQGSVANKITAEALGFQKILSATAAVNADQDEVFPAVVSVDGSQVLLVVAAETAHVPTDVTDTVTLTVLGVS